MPESNNSPPPPTPAGNRDSSGLSAAAALKIAAVALVAAAIVAYQLDSFDPAAIPGDELTREVAAVAECNGGMLRGAEYVGLGKLAAAEDMAFDSEAGLVYTGDSDGWIKRVRLNDSVVENWAFTGGRPLGIALGPAGDVFVADAYKGVLKASGAEGAVEALTGEAGGVKFGLTDGIDVAEDGAVYFTDASWKYGFHDFIYDILEGRPLGRLMRYDPTTGKTEILAAHLYFANGVAVAPTQEFLVFCETPFGEMKFQISPTVVVGIAGEDAENITSPATKKGSIEKFIENLPGTPDNIRYDGEGHYWIGLSTEMTNSWYLSLRIPAIRKVLAMMEKKGRRPKMEKNGGVVAVDVEGKAVAWYYDYELSMVTTGIKIGNHLYCGSLAFPGILRLDLDRFPARSAACPRSNSDL